MQAAAVVDMPVLVSFASWASWMDSYQKSWARVLVDSGAYSAHTTGKAVCVDAYADWAATWDGRADAVAGLDDIGGDWRRSLANYERCGFPTMHDSDPDELLDDLVSIARERGGWLGVGLVPPRQGKEQWLMRTLDRVPDDLHVHGWALRGYRHLGRLDSVDSTNWWRDMMALRSHGMPLQWLTPAECLDIVVKRYQRERRGRVVSGGEPDLFAPASGEED